MQAKLLDLMFNGASYSTPNKYVALFTTMPADDGTGYCS